MDFAYCLGASGLRLLSPELHGQPALNRPAPLALSVSRPAADAGFYDAPAATSAFIASGGFQGGGGGGGSYGGGRGGRGGRNNNRGGSGGFGSGGALPADRTLRWL